ncbi:MAG: radical SAM protein [Candidatus Pacearchaeota archaeon]
MLENKLIRKLIFYTLDKTIKFKFYNLDNNTKKIAEDKYLITSSVLKAIDKQYNQGISKGCKDKLENIFIKKQFLRVIKKRKLPYQDYQIGFLTVSPTNICDLSCKDCYAGFIKNKQTLPFSILIRIWEDIKNIFKTNFMVISGGEPTLYEYEEKGKKYVLEDLLEKNQDIYHLMYTNGRRIAEDFSFVKRISELGNLTPAISIEGFEEKTDLRRGKGMYKKIIKAMDNLRKEGIPFGISLTMNKYNIEELLSDEFIKEMFDKRGAVYAWSFHYMPIGKNPSFDLLITPEQRLWSFKRIRELLKQGYFIADFWDLGTVAGCMASGGDGGSYGYIDWTGNIYSCVFMPDQDKDETKNNVYNLYKNEYNLKDAFDTVLHKKIREIKATQKNKCNLCLPCTIRDRSNIYSEIIEKYGKYDSPTKEYREKIIKTGLMEKYNKECEKLFSKIWEEYLK